MSIFTIKLTRILNRSFHFLCTIIVLMPVIVFSQPYTNPAPVVLGAAGTYGALASTGLSGSANVSGDIGTLTGSIESSITTSGTNWGVGGTNNSNAQNDLTAAINDVIGRTNNADITGGALGGLTLTQGIYGGTSALDLAAGETLTLSGNAAAIFIIKSASSLVINSGSTISLTGGAVWSNVFWYVPGATTIFNLSTFNGVILSGGQITLNLGATSVTAKLLTNTGSISMQSNVLPVELTSFKAGESEGSVLLDWQTATEVNNYGFDVERASTSVETTWQKISFVQGHGNSNSPKSYSFKDSNVPAGKVSYRLKQIDFDGKFEYSSAVEVIVEAPSTFSVKQNFPNPFNPSTMLSYQLPANSLVNVKIFDVLGREVTTLVNENQVAGTHNLNFDGKNLPSGMYVYKVQAGSYVQVKKMLLMK